MLSHVYPGLCSTASRFRVDSTNSATKRSLVVAILVGVFCIPMSGVCAAAQQGQVPPALIKPDECGYVPSRAYSPTAQTSEVKKAISLLESSGELAVGHFAIQALPQGAITVVDLGTRNGIINFRIRVKADAGQFVFSSASGIKLGGPLSSISLEASTTLSQGGNPPFLCVPVGKLQLAFRPTDYQVAPLFGSSRIRLSDADVQATNRKRILIDTRNRDGELAFSVKDAAIDGLQFVIPSSTGTVTADITGDGTAVLSIPRSELEIEDGLFSGSIRRQQDLQLCFPSDECRYSLARFTIGKTELKLVKSSAEVRFLGVRANSTLALQSKTYHVSEFFSGQASAASIKAQAGRSLTPGALSGVILSGVVLTPKPDTVARPYELSPEELSLGNRIDFISPEAQRAKSIETSAAVLEGITSPNFLIQISGTDVVQQYKSALKRLNLPEIIHVQFGKQEMILWGSIKLPSDAPSSSGSIVVLTISPSIAQQQVLLRPSVSFIRFQSLQFRSTYTAIQLVSMLQTRVDELAKRSGGWLPEVPIPLDLNLIRSVDAASLMPTGVPYITSVTANPVQVKLSVQRAALLIDDDGIHLLGEITRQ
jgi:hypothetical protein